MISTRTILRRMILGRLNLGRLNLRGLILRGLGPLAVIAPLLAVSACTQADDYTLPQKICGRAIEPAKLKPLLPSGSEFAEKHDSDSSSSVCEISVDKKPALYVKEFKNQEKFDVMDFATQRTGKFRDPEKIGIGEDAVVSDSALLLATTCTEKKNANQYILDIESVTGNGSDGQRKDLESFATAYLPTGFAAMGCTAKP
ncbi:hypothetical protein [Streptomyces paludis]|uniref:DUF3558 domain-containing protein n=1 Tax=Streptomyces paludis TaxID=2282738 RepID=A0A345HV90_9ACTN|nr:hypothetical protein [Streptomyces paludis]AXG80614.1 hypothetical protein DVK44_26365 [Streptomyces paludis]